MSEDGMKGYERLLDAIDELPPEQSTETDVIERMARAIAEASDDGCFDRIDAGEADDSSGDWEDADYYRRLARAAHGAVFPPGRES